MDIMDCASSFERMGPLNGKGESDGPGAYRRTFAGSYHETGVFLNVKGEGKAATAVAGDLAHPAVPGDQFAPIPPNASTLPDAIPPPPARAPPSSLPDAIPPLESLYTMD